MATMDGFRRRNLGAGGRAAEVVRAAQDGCAARMWRAGAALAMGMVLVGAGGAGARGQAVAMATRSTSAVYLMGGFENSQWTRYSDNALGANLGFFVQPRRLVGGEVRGGLYPVSAKYLQSAFSVGARVGSVFGNSRWEPYGYFGVGGSRGQDQAANGNVMPAAWAPCWQAAIGLDMNYEKVSVRLADVSWRETYTPGRNLRTVGVNIGVVYRFDMGSPQLR